ncbi:MAG: sulfotransferase domain-containing protein [Rhizomicrobium sp.]
MTLPNFIVIGPGKTGTTWLYQCLAAHPQIGLARNTKETLFFNDYYGRGLSWYEKFFDGIEAPAIGEVSNTYFFNPGVPGRIAAELPKVKLIAFLRDPVDRVMSLYLFRLRNGLVKGSLDDAIAADSSMVAQNFFDEHLARWFAAFPREQIFIALFEDLKRDPRQLLRNLYEFVGVDPDFVPEVAGQRVLEASAPRSPGLFHALKRFALWLRDHDFHRALSWAKTNPYIMGLLTRPLGADKPRMPPETRARLQAIYRPHIRKTELLIGRDLKDWL